MGMAGCGFEQILSKTSCFLDSPLNILIEFKAEVNNDPRVRVGSQCNVLTITARLVKSWSNAFSAVLNPLCDV